MDKQEKQENAGETTPVMKDLYMRIFRCGYEQGAIDLKKGKIKVQEDEHGYYIITAEEAEKESK